MGKGRRKILGILPKAQKGGQSKWEVEEQWPHPVAY